jgi:hypothetical protein
MLALGVQNDAPWTPLQPTLGNGIHLRWFFGPSEEFPRGGFYLLRRVSNEGNATFCISQILTRTLLGTLVGTADDVQLNVLNLLRSAPGGGFVEFSSDRFIRLVDLETPDETFELDLTSRSFLSTSIPVSYRVDYKVALGQPAGTGGPGTRTPAGAAETSGSSTS